MNRRPVFLESMSATLAVVFLLLKWVDGGSCKILNELCNILLRAIIN